MYSMKRCQTHLNIVLTLPSKNWNITFHTFVFYDATISLSLCTHFCAEICSMLAGVYEYIILAVVATLLLIAVFFIVIMVCKFRRKLRQTARFAFLIFKRYSIICCILYYLLIFVFIWATSSDERFAFLVARHCALHCFVRIHLYFVAQLAK